MKKIVYRVKRDELRFGTESKPCHDVADSLIHDSETY